MNASRRYLSSLAVAALALLAAAVAFIWFVDPYLLEGQPRVAGFNALKPHGGDHGLIAKERMAVARRPTTLIVGNSRVEVGFDPDILNAPGERVFAAGLPGETLSTLMPMVRRIAERAPLSRVYVGLDYIDFVEPRTPKPVRPAKSDPHGDLLQRAMWQAETRVSMGALIAAAETVASQRSALTDTISDGGHNPMRSYEAYNRTIGQAGVFHAYLRKLRASFADRLPPRHDGAAFTRQRQALADLVALSREKKFELVFFFYPLHAFASEVMAREGHWEPFLSWRSDVAGLIRELNSASQTAWPLVDFMSYQGVAAESAPPDDDRKTRMAHWIEPGHFRPDVGSAMFDRMRDLRGVADFGVVVTAQDVAARNEALSAEQSAWRDANGPERERLDRWLAHP